MNHFRKFLPIVILLVSIQTGVGEEKDSSPQTIDAAKYDSLQDAFDAIPEAGGIVRIPPGKYEITEPLRLTVGDVSIQGSGTATHIVNKNEDGQPAVLIGHPDCSEPVQKCKNKLWRVHVTDLRITGNEKSGHGIEARQVNEIYLEGITVSENGGDGIFLNFCYEDPRIADCLLTYNKKNGIHLLGCHDIVVNANHFEENLDALLCADGFNLCMNGNNLDDHLRHGVVIENTYGSVLSGNMIEECQGTAVVLDRDCYGITVSANVIAHNGGGVDLRDAHGCAVSANTFTINKTKAISIGPDSGRITVTGNNFSNSYIGESSIKRKVDDADAGGILIDNASHVTITGNIFSGLTEKAVTLNGDQNNIVFAHNVLVDVESDLSEE